MKNRILALAAFSALSCSSTAAFANCTANFQSSGTPLLTAIMFRTWDIVPKVGADAALNNVARAVAAEGFANISINKQLGSVDAEQEMTGSGRPQYVRFVVRRQSTGVRVDATFQIQAGQVAPEAAVRTYLCRVIAAAR